MDTQQIFTIAMFTTIMCLSPGPNNLMVAASGANHGFRKTIPHILGIMLGCFILFSAVAAGLGGVFTTFPTLQIVLKIISSVFLLYIAYKIAFGHNSSNKLSESKLIRFHEAFLFQLINPKAWAGCITAVSTFTSQGESYSESAIIMVGLYMLILLPSISIWTYLGIKVQAYLRTTTNNIKINYVLGGLIALCVITVAL